MASTKDYRDFILDQLSILNGVTYKPMMGEYLLYYNGVLFGGIYDDRFLVKKTETNNEYEMEEAIPYTGAKPMYMVDSDDQELVKDIVLDTVRGLKK